MKLKRISACAALLLFMFSATRAQELETNSVVSETEPQNEMNDSLKALQDEPTTTSLLSTDVEKSASRGFVPLEGVWNRKKYIKLGFGNPTIDRIDGEELSWKTQFAISFQKGKTIYFHSQPLWGMVKFGLDYGFINISYTKLKLKPSIYSSAQDIPLSSNSGNGFDDIISEDPSGSIMSMVTSMMGINLGLHKFEISPINVGPSINVNPWNHLIASAYFHVLLTGSGIIENSQFSAGFGVVMQSGISVSYKAISIGVEGVWSKIKYTQLSFDEDDESESFIKTKNYKLKQRGFNFYIAYRY